MARSLKLFVLFACRSLGLFRLAHWATRRHLKILCYHGFALSDESAFRPKLFMTPASFDRRLRVIQRYNLCVLPLHDAVERLYAGSLPERSLVITIDDGFHSVHRVAVPSLRRFGYASTVYLTTYYVEHPHPIFRLVVQYMFWKTAQRRVSLDGVRWSTRGEVDLSDRAQAEQVAWECIRYGEGQRTEEIRVALCRELGELLETPYAEIARRRILHLMTPDELQSLDGAGMSVELHTHRHVFPADDRARAEREIADNMAAIQRLLAREPRHFCYPSGLWDPGQWPWLDAMRVRSSATCDPGLNSATTPPHALRRFLDGENIHPLEFEAALTGFSDLLRALRPGPRVPD